MNRRDFIQTLSLAAAGLYAGALSARQPEIHKTRILGLQLYSVRDALSKDLEKTLRRIRELGFNSVELFGYEGKFFGKTASEFRKMLDDNGLSAISSHHLLGKHQKSHGTLHHGWQKTLDDLNVIGVRYAACAWLFPEERTTEVYSELPEILNRCGETSKVSGINLTYHNHDFEFEKFGDATAYDHLLKNTQADLVNMELDLYWMSKTKNDPVAYFEKYPGRFPLWHVKDMDANGDFTEVGNGKIDFDRIFAAREKAGLNFWFVEQDESKADMFDSLSKSVAFVKKKKF